MDSFRRSRLVSSSVPAFFALVAAAAARAVAAVVAVVAVVVVAPAAAGADGPSSAAKQFRFKGSKVEVGSLYRYERTSLDAVKEGFLLVHVPARNKLIALRGEKGAATADEFLVDLDWENGGTASRFEWYTVGKDRSRRRALTEEMATGTGVLSVTPEELSGSRIAPFQKGTVVVGHLPAHLAPLDLVTLGLAIRFMSEPRKEAQVGIVGDGVPGAFPFAYKGKATIRFVELVNRDGNNARKYAVTADFLAGAEAAVWVDDAKGHIVDVEIPLAAGGWKDLKYYLTSYSKSDDGGWEKARAEALATLK